MRSKLFFVLILVLLCVAPASFSQTWETYTINNSGLVSNNVRAVVVDENGIKWFGTDSGLSRFDGSSWKTYQATNAQQTLASNNIHDIIFEKTDYGTELWLATDNGVSVALISIDAITCATPYRKENRPLISNTVHAVAVDNTHIRWFGTDAGLSSFTGSDWMSYTAYDYLSNNYILSISSSTDGWKYIGTKGGGVSRVFNNGIDAITSASPYDYDWSGLLSDSVYVVYVLEDGTQWFGTDEGAAYHRSTQTKFDWDVFTTDDGLVHNFVQAIVRDKDGVMWFGTKGGVSNYNGETWKSYTTADGLSGNIVYDIDVDLDGSLWFATDNGVTQYSGNIVSVESSDFEKGKIDDFQIFQNYPNPFNLSTNICYQLSTSSAIQLDIYNIEGQLIKSLVNGYRSMGTHNVVWDGTNDDGSLVSSGVYIYKLIVNSNIRNYELTRKMLFLK